MTEVKQEKYDKILEILCNERRIRNGSFIIRALESEEPQDSKRVELNRFAVANIIEELLDKQQLDISEENIKYIGNGGFSIVFQIGEYVFKIGMSRHDNRIKKHRRLLQPILRTKISDDIYAEVQNLVDKDWHRQMSEAERDDIVTKLKVELQKDGLIWCDDKFENVGRLLKPNRVNLKTGKVQTGRGLVDSNFTSDSSIGFYGEDVEVLPQGEYVILDTDNIIESNIIYDNMVKNLFYANMPRIAIEGQKEEKTTRRKEFFQKLFIPVNKLKEFAQNIFKTPKKNKVQMLQDTINSSRRVENEMLKNLKVDVDESEVDRALFASQKDTKRGEKSI